MSVDNKPSEDQLFRIITIDRQRRVKMNIQLRDKDGDEVPVRETVEKLTEWVSDQLGSDNEVNTCRQQIMPLMAHAVVGGMFKFLDRDMAASMLSTEVVRYSLVHMMSVGFYLLKWLQKKDIKIFTSEEPITQDELEMYDRLNNANSIMNMAQNMGVAPEDALIKLVQDGKLHAADLEQFGIKLPEKKGTN